MRLLSLFWCSGLLATLALPARAQTPVAVDDLWLPEVAVRLVEHYQPEGELTLEWARRGAFDPSQPAELTVINFPSTLSPQMLLRVRAVTEAGEAEHTLILRAQLWRDGWAAREPTARGEPVYGPALELQRFDALRDRDAVAADDGADLIYTRSVPAGRLLTWRDVGRRPLVRRGQMIEVAATDGPLTVTLRAVALADAGRGEVVRVRNPDTRREFAAQVVADARAQVRF